ncbi:C39 family peptidase [Lysinibacillus sp. NPDC097287]|uniref:C39 family peptidase n=1 Tax=Lysinibacillus sp. NPDC097287 TaxID=3364144 RepID=UPI0038000C00
MWTKHKRLIFICFIVLMLSGCKQLTKEEKNKLTVLTVEFHSGAPIPDLYITITDLATGVEVEDALGSAEGEATFSKLVEGKEYAIAATTLENSVAGDGYTTIDTFTYDGTKPYYKLQTQFSRDEQELDVPIVMQNPELPHGCEITSLTAVLNYYGLNVSKLEMADRYLPKQKFEYVNGQRFGPNPAHAFAGNPRDKQDGMYVFAAPIVKAAEAVIADNQMDLRVTDMSGKSKEEILKLVQDGIPVVVWVTLDLSSPKKNKGWIYDGEQREGYSNLHAVVLTGHLDGKVVVMDPLKGYVTYNEDQFFKSYQQLGTQAVAVH